MKLNNSALLIGFSIFVSLEFILNKSNNSMPILDVDQLPIPFALSAQATQTKDERAGLRRTLQGCPSYCARSDTMPLQRVMGITGKLRLCD
jgi:hypothetical protein